MSERSEETDRAPLATLRAFAGQRAPVERCELCGKALHSVHPHLARIDVRQLVCACEPCALLFADNPTAPYRRVPRDITRLVDFALSDEQWDALMIPIDLAFFLHSSRAGHIVAVYPSPAGPTESQLPLTAWDDLVAGHPRLRTLLPDVEALLVNRVRRGERTGPRYLVVPIDECYRLVGLMRKSWRGLSGGTEVWREIAAYFADLDARAGGGRTEVGMPDLSFAIDGAAVVPFAATPQLAFMLRVSCLPANQPIHTIALRCQVQLEATRRRYAPGEQERLSDLFGTPDRWDRTLRTMLWTHTQTVVPRFVGSTVVDLPVPCTFDFNVATTKYFDGLDGGDVPLNFQFSGTVFYPGSDGALQVMQIAWDKDVRHRLPVSVWTGMMDHYYPDSAWLRLRRDVLRQLAAYKQQHGCATWDEALEALLADVSIGARR